MADPRPPLSYDEFVAEQESEKIPFEVQGRTFYIIPPDLMSDEDSTTFFELMGKDADEVGPDGLVRLARTMIDDYDGFAALGGTAGRLHAYMAALAAQRDDALKAEQGVDEGEDGAS